MGQLNFIRRLSYSVVKIILILPSQRSIYSNLYEVYNDLFNGITGMSVQCKVVEVALTGKAKFPFGVATEIGLSELLSFIKSEAEDGTFFITVDDYDLMKWLWKQETLKNVIIWAHYFYGHRYIFKSYRLSRPPLTLTLDEKTKSTLSGFVPSMLGIYQSRFYWRTLKRYPVFSQSTWTGLLLERVYGIPILGNVPIPVDSNLYTYSLTSERKDVLVFLGNALDTDLEALWMVLKSLGTEYFGNIDFFGNEDSGNKFEKRYGVDVNFIGKISREELIRQYSSHFFTISPIFGGNFEMVPIQSLLSGTPVITFPQPFMEVAGNHTMIANINNIGEVRAKAKEWTNIDIKTKEQIRSIILERMDAKNVANNLLQYISELSNYQLK